MSPPCLERPCARGLAFALCVRRAASSLVRLSPSGRVQRAWVGNMALRREREAEKNAAAAEILGTRLQRARAHDLRHKHHAALIARTVADFVRRRRSLVSSLHGWLSKRVSKQSRSLLGFKWRKRYFWVASGALRYDSVRAMADPALRGAPLKYLREAVASTKVPGEFSLTFGSGGPADCISIMLRSDVPSDAEFWRRSLLWLAHLTTQLPPPRTLTLAAAAPRAPPAIPAPSVDQAPQPGIVRNRENKVAKTGHRQRKKEAKPDPAKWVFVEKLFAGAQRYLSIGEVEEVQGVISEGVEKFEVSKQVST